MDTIFALATAAGRAGIAVIRVSGPAAMSAAEGLAGPLPACGRSLRRLEGDEGDLDEALILTFPEGASFTGEAVVEFHLHGSPAVVQAVTAELARDGRLRGAEPGEFTRRALVNGRLDLAQVEGLADLIDAETEVQRKQAMRVFRGALGAKVELWRARAIRAMALVEATIDFVDEEVPVDVWPEVSALVEELARELDAEIAAVSVAERIRTGFEVAIVGAPNVGKSTLLNRIAGREAAITSRVAGTTRDVIEVRMDLNGLPVTLLDTAGLRESEDEVERIGVARGQQRAREADLRVHLVELNGQPLLEVQPGDLVLSAQDDAGRWANGVSGLTGQGVDALISRLTLNFQERTACSGVAIRERHRAAMRRASGLLHELVSGADHGDVELIGERLRMVTRCLDSLVGRVDVEDVLGEIFQSFCIGK